MNLVKLEEMKTGPLRTGYKLDELNNKNKFI